MLLRIALRNKNLWACCALLTLLSCVCAWAQQPVPNLNQRVTDLTGTLTAVQQAHLEQRLAELEAAKGSQIAMLIVASTQPESIEQYSLRVAEAWRLGRESIDDGVLLLIATQDRQLRIEVGYGLEGAIPGCSEQAGDQRIHHAITASRRFLRWRQCRR